MRFFLFTLMLLCSLTGLSQYTEGLYITDTGQKINGYFKTTDFENFENLQFSVTQGGPYTGLPLNTNEYTIGNEYKFKKYTVELDNSGKGTAISVSKNPEWVKRTVFLNTVVEGDATLYSYRFNNETKFFYSVTSKNLPVKQLVFKQYKPGTAIIKNMVYRQDLYNDVRCTDDNGNTIAKLEYARQDFISVFEKYNTCTNSQFKVYTNRGGATSEFKITAFAGITYSTLKLDNETSSDKDSGTGFTVGAEVMYVMPSSHLAGFLRINYEKINKEVKGGSDLSETISSVYTADISSVNLIIGPRYLITDNLFIDAGFGINFAFGDLYQESFRRVASEDISIGRLNYDISSPVFFSFGAGYAITKNFGVDLRYNTVSNLLPSGSDLKLGSASLNLRYTFN